MPLIPHPVGSPPRHRTAGVNDDNREVRATRVDRHGVVLTHAAVLAPPLRVVDVTTDEELASWNVIAVGEGHLESVCIERHGELGVIDISLFDTDGPRRG